MATEDLRLWDPDGGYVDFDGQARWLVPKPAMPGYLFTDSNGDETLSLPPQDLLAQGHPGRCSLLFYADQILLLSSDDVRHLHEWLDEYVRSKRSTLVAYVRALAADGDEDLDILRFFQVQALSYPGPLMAMLAGIEGRGMPASDDVLSIEFLCSAWGTVDDYDTEPDVDDEMPDNVTVTWRRAQ